MLIDVMEPHPFSNAELRGVYRAIHERRDVRSHFLPDPIPAEVLGRILDAAHHAPSVGFMQPWDFVVIEDHAVRRAVYDNFERANRRAAEIYNGEQRRIYDSLKLAGILEAPLNLCVTCDRSRRNGNGLGRQTSPETDLYSTVCAVQNLWLAARAESLGVGWVSILDIEELGRTLGIPPDVTPVAYLCIGYVSEFRPLPDLEEKGWERRESLAGLIHFDGWGTRDERRASALLSPESIDPSIQPGPCRALMVLGTASHVGKSLLTAALGRILADDGYRVAPFKAQNMSLNSSATPDGCEIGRAQALQAEACRVTPQAEMNPILLKPSTDASSQVVVLGRVWAELTAADYHQSRVEELFPIVRRAYHELAANHDLMVLEGAGSPAEINLKSRDIVNMRMACEANAACVLVGDIDRGGVFAALLGTLELLDAQERAMIRGFIINKFRGDVELLRPGIRMIEEQIGIPCVGVVPYLPEPGLEEEDSVALEHRRSVSRAWPVKEHADESPRRQLRIGVIALPYLSNFTDFDVLAAEPSVALAFIENPSDVSRADMLILPGTKQTLDDLDWIRTRGFADAIIEFPGSIAGICGGMQMLGLEIADPTGTENRGVARKATGLALLPISTILNPGKITKRVRGCVTAPSMPLCAAGAVFDGYEIHLGETIYADAAVPFAAIQRAGENGDWPDGAVNADGRVFGTYVHGIFDNDSFRHSVLAALRQIRDLAPARRFEFVTEERERRIDRLADHVRRSLNLELIRSWVAAPAAREAAR